MDSQSETTSISNYTCYIIIATPNKLICKKFISNTKEYPLITHKDLRLNLDAQDTDYIEWISNKSSYKFAHLYDKHKVRACYKQNSSAQINKIVIPWVGENIRGDVLIYSAHYADQDNDDQYEYGAETNKAFTLTDAKKVFKKLKQVWIEPSITAYTHELIS
jgi:hypothetical protein